MANSVERQAQVRQDALQAEQTESGQAGRTDARPARRSRYAALLPAKAFLPVLMRFCVASAAALSPIRSCALAIDWLTVSSVMESSEKPFAEASTTAESSLTLSSSLGLRAWMMCSLLSIVLNTRLALTPFSNRTYVASG